MDDEGNQDIKPSLEDLYLGKNDSSYNKTICAEPYKAGGKLGTYEGSFTSDNNSTTDFTYGDTQQFFNLIEYQTL